MMLNDGAFLLLLLGVILIVGWLLHVLVKCPDNKLEWQDLVATNGYLNSYKIGWWIGVGVTTWLVVKQTYSGTIEVGMVGLYLAFLGGVNVGMSAIGAKYSKPDKPLSRGDPVIE